MDDAVSISEAKAQLSKLVARVERGEVVVLSRGRKPVAKIVPFESPERSPRRVFGALRGQIWMADDFDELGPEWDESV